MVIVVDPGEGIYPRLLRFFPHRSLQTFLALILPFNRPREILNEEKVNPAGKSQKFLSIELACCCFSLQQRSVPCATTRGPRYVLG